MVLGSGFPEKATVGQQYPGVIRTKAHRSCKGRREDPTRSSFAESPERGRLASCVGEEGSRPMTYAHHSFFFFPSPKDAFRAVKKRIVGNKNFHEVMLALTVSLSACPSIIAPMAGSWSESCFFLLRSSGAPIHAWFSYLRTRKESTMEKLLSHPQC